jgi:ABC-type lipoprotein release transport system permease subunit
MAWPKAIMLSSPTKTSFTPVSRCASEWSARRLLSHARVAQALLQQPSGASMIIYKLRNPDRAPTLASRFETLFQHSALSWQQREESTLQLFLTLRMSVAITVSLIILLAGFGIFNVLTMSVLAKIKEIAILRSMGYRRIDISSIFLWQGALIAAAGSLLGCALGALMTWGVSHIPIRLRGLLYTNYFLVTGTGVIMSSRRYWRLWPFSSRVTSPRDAPLNCRPLSPFEGQDEWRKLSQL